MNDHLLLNVRIKDEIKQQAIINATIELVNEIGFAASSVAKIAKRAGVSPATLYVYYKNKEDLLVSTYVEIKKCLGSAVVKDFSSDLPIRDALFQAGRNLFTYTKSNPDLFNFTVQFSNSPYNDLVDSAEVDKAFEPITKMLQRGIDEKIIKDVPFELLFAYLYHPIFSLENHRLNPRFEVDDTVIETSLTMAWDAIKL